MGHVVRVFRGIFSVRYTSRYTRIFGSADPAPPVTTQRAGGDGGPWMSYFKCKQLAYTFIYENGLLRNHKFHRHGR